MLSRYLSRGVTMSCGSMADKEIIRSRADSALDNVAGIGYSRAINCSACGGIGCAAFSSLCATPTGPSLLEWAPCNCWCLTHEHRTEVRSGVVIGMVEDPDGTG